MNPLNFHFKKPDTDLVDFVYAFSTLTNVAEIDKGIIIPNGKIDLMWCKTKDKCFCVKTSPKGI
ncbi:MAG TPA: hypothetical protein DEQ26_14835 [Flavobacteriaceae bacterium]|uniref:hypothetical protein n=1 Tax=Empedobacter sp. GD03644 TaxID=2975358 RepID=UPI000EDD8256|nr:hypothetical protein [Empedobacter sp. GD03644]MDH2208070.1 hypothetical protein [Empedobacter sp. GD03644]HCC95567.1 hypothetical protein [Flavobacteriaceae bacterium]